MKVVADLHLHSKYSRAVSKDMVVSEMSRWARIKGLDLLAAPDWTHPLFSKELKKDLIETGEGIFAYKNDRSGPKFLLSTEISSIYSQGGRGRRIHNLVMAPSFEVADRISQALRALGANLMADGRPIIGLSAVQLLELVMEIDRRCLVIPAHVWTPWFSLYGSRSGFDSLRECFGGLARHIYGIETGISSDPLMNWQFSELDSRSILSFSDAHSPAKMGREATVFGLKNKTGRSKYGYDDIAGAIRQEKSTDWQIDRTFEFYPEEGKYHYTGHRKCGVVHSPELTKKLGRICPVCGKELTVGVMHRVQQLAGIRIKKEKLVIEESESGVRFIGYQNRPQYIRLVPLLEILSEVFSVGVKSKKVINEYKTLIDNLGHELRILLDGDLKKIAAASTPETAEGVKRVRQGRLTIDPGYDGLFGRVKIWDSAKKKEEKEQMSLL